MRYNSHNGMFLILQATKKMLKHLHIYGFLLHVQYTMKRVHLSCLKHNIKLQKH